MADIFKSFFPSKEDYMNKKQLSALFLCNLVPFTIGFAMIPLLPVYATKLGAAPAISGYWMAFTYVAMALGSIIAGWLSDRFQRRKLLLILAGLISIPSIWLMGLTTNIWHLVILSSATYFFLGGMVVALVNALAGLFADKTERGKIFGILQMAISLGAFLGGSIAGPIADRWGYPTMFFALALFGMILPLVALSVEDKVLPRRKQMGSEKTVGLALSFWFLTIAQITISIVFFVGHLTRTLGMNDLGFSSTGISSVVAVGGALTLPLPFLIGRLSDRIGRKRLLALCYLMGILGISLQAMSNSWWHFCTAAVLLAFMSRVGGSVGSALVTDLVPQQSLGMGISLYRAANWVGGIIGWSGTGYAIENIGILSSLITASFLPLIAIILLIFIQSAKRREEIATAS
jgi:MFS family permease